MAPPSDQDELAIAWRALGATEPREGWRTIPLAPALPLRVLAARSFPGNEEAILVGFRNVRVPPAQHLPQGRGFAVERVDPGLGGVWIALSRQGTASLTLFSLMAQDVIGTLAGAAPGQEEAVLHAFLARIRAWQEFMLKGSDGVLGPDAEVGLLGELLFLGDLLRLPMEPSPVIEAWQGPLDGLQDFVLGTGAVEVKTTLVMGAFPAVVASLEQLDDSCGDRCTSPPSGLRWPPSASPFRSVERQERSSPALDFGCRRTPRHAGCCGPAIWTPCGARIRRRFNPAEIAADPRHPRLPQADES